jgi:3-dehydroquinate synthase
MDVVRVELGDRAYPIHIGSSAVNSLREWSVPFPRRQLVVIADQTVADLHGPRLAAALPPDAVTLTFPAGETSKSFTAMERLCEQLATRGIERGAAIIAFGGGVAGDLAGFIAGTWLRGVGFVQVPTTFLAAVDASVGGKTGINLHAGKNLVGVFHQPELVVIDTDFLATLPDRDLRAGLAESVKHAVIRQPDLLDRHLADIARIAARDPQTLGELIAANCAIKAAVVAADEREADLRMILNHGHTIGHAFEHLLGYELRHGECVALGMLVENELARRRGLLKSNDAARIAAVLARLGLPQRLPRAVGAADVLAACRIDKKVRAGAVNFVLLAGLGQPVRVADIADAEIEAALAIVAAGG